MSNEQKLPDNATENQQIRHHLVTTAVNFLLNPSVIDKANEHKSAFLRKKGLTEAEISLAYEKAESDPRYKQIQNGNVSSYTPVLPPPVPAYRHSVTFWSKLSRLSSSVIVIGVAVYGAHYVYKTYIEPLIYGVNESKSSKLEKQLLEMMNSISQLEKHVSALEENMNAQKMQMDKFLQNEVSEYYPTPLALRELKSEIGSVKSLLLNRHQFPALPKITAPTIPHWQLPTSDNNSDTTKQNGETDEDKHSSEDNSATKLSHELNSENDTCVFVPEINNGTEELTENLEAKSAQDELSKELVDSSPVS